MKQNLKQTARKRLAAMALFLLICLPFSLAQAQTVKVNGRVTDDLNEPMIGVSIFEKGTTNGVITDMDGNYSLSVKEGATIVYSYIGYLTQEKKAVAGVMNVILKEDTKTLDEVVVVGYGVQKKSSLTGAVSSVKSEDMEARTITRAEQALQGKTAGVQVLSASAKPGASPQVRIRGISSNGSCDPLYVVDGRIASDIGGIDPNDIESMEVLKDGASAAIYGAAAGNGVVLITTKKGKGNGKITYDFQYTSQSLGKVPEVMNAAQYKEFFLENKKLTQSAFDTYWDGKTDTDWVDEAFENSSMVRHNVTFQGGSDRGSFYLSLSHLDNDGMIVGNADTYERLTGMVNASWKIKPWLEVGTNNQIEHYKTQSVAEGNEYGSMMLSVLQLDPLTKPLYPIDDLPLNMATIYKDHKNMLGDGNGNLYGVSAFTGNAEAINPFAMRDNSYTKNRGFNINGSTYLNFMPIKGLTVTSRLSYRLASTSSYGVGQSYYYTDKAKRDWVEVSASDYSPTYYQWENFLNYTRSFGKHNATLMLGTSYSQSRSYGVSGSKKGYNEDTTDMWGNVINRVSHLGFLQNDPNFFYFAYATSDAVKDVSGGEPTYTRKLSYFGRLNYDYANRYLLELNGRYDASSKFPSGSRWGFFPSLSVGWRVMEESFMEPLRDYIPEFKIRGSIGTVGNQNIDPYQFVPSMESEKSKWLDNNTQPITLKQPGLVSGNFTWETVRTLNLGFDISALKNRLSANFDLFRRDTKDMLTSGSQLPATLGATAPLQNVADLKSTGFELELAWRDQIGKVHYNIGFNLYDYKAYITKFKNNVAGVIRTSDNKTYVEGQQLGEIWGYVTDRLYTVDDFVEGTLDANLKNGTLKDGIPHVEGVKPNPGDMMFKDLDGNGIINSGNETIYDPGDRKIIGNNSLRFQYGIDGGLSWNNLSFSFLLQGVGKCDKWLTNDLIFPYYYEFGTIYEHQLDYWTPENTGAFFPRLYETGMRNTNYAANVRAQTKYLTNGAYLRVKNLTLGYTIPQSVISKIGISNLRVYVSAENPFTFDHMPKGLDPAVESKANGLGYPFMSSYAFGFSVSL